MDGKSYNWMRIAALLAIIACSLLGAACAGRDGVSHGGTLVAADIPSVAEPRDVTQILAELEQLTPPDGVDATQFSQLKAAVADALQSRGDTRVVSAAPVIAGSAIDHAIPFDAGSSVISFSWNERNPGDYDLNGIVNLADLALVAKNNGLKEGQEGWAKARVADGNADKHIGPEDAAIIGANYMSRIAGYNVYRSLPGGSAPDLLAKVERNNALILGGVVVQYSYDDTSVETPGQIYLYEVHPIANPDGSGEGLASQTWQLQAGQSYGITPTHDVETVVDDNGQQRLVVAGELLLTYRINPTREQLLRTAYAQIGAEIIGQLPGTQTYRLELPRDTSYTIAHAASAVKGTSATEGFSVDYNYIVPGPVPIEAVTGTADSRSTSLSYADPLRSQLWGLDAAYADTAWDTGEGTGVVVAVIDTGVKVAHEDLAGQTVTGARFGGSEVWSDDTAGHGTHVAGTIAAAGGNAKGVVGLANKARIMPLRCGALYSGSWSFPVSDLTAAVNYAVQNGAKVINMSLGGQGVLGSAFETALQNAETAGVVVVAAAGNDNVSAQGFYPATYPTVLSVGAVGPALARAPFSNYGYPDYVDICAPGGDGTYNGAILSTVITSTSSYDRMQGTSMACPHAAALAALILSVNPGLTPVEVRQLMQTTGRTIPASTQVGPLINAQAALAALGAPGTHSISGTIQRADLGKVAGVTVTLDSNPAKTALTDANGSYTITGVADGSYTLTPSRAGYSFNPASLAVQLSGSALTGQNFTATQSATVEVENNDTVAQAGVLPDLPFDASMFFGSLGSGTGYTANDGDATDFYKFSVTAPMQVTFTMTFNTTANLDLYLFNTNGSTVLGKAVNTSGTTETVAASLPSAGTYYLKCLRVTGYSDYSLAASTLPTYSVGGKITKVVGGAALAGVTLTLTGEGKTLTAKSSATGVYLLTGATAGNYTLTPSLAGRSFTPDTYNVTISDANITDKNFSAAGPFTVAGAVYLTTGAVLAGATLNLTGPNVNLTTTSGTDGKFLVANVPNGTFTLTCSAKGRSFTPESIQVTVANTNVAGCYFLGEGPFSVAGTVTTASGTAIAAVTMRLEGNGYSLSATSTSLGKFTVAGAPNGTYTLTPSSKGRTFTPASRTVTIQSGNVTGVSFTGEGPFTVSGKVTNQADGLPVSGVKVTLTNGSLVLTASTNAAGDYTVTYVPNGSYTLTATRTGRAFSPGSKSVTVASGNAGGVDFSSYPVYSISGKTTKAGVALPGVTVTITGPGLNVTAITGATGLYTFAGLPVGSYTLTASKSGAVFAPASRAVSLTTANAASQNFATP